jgi:hypothetical protein
MSHIHVVKASEITGTKVKNIAGENFSELAFISSINKYYL